VPLVPHTGETESGLPPLLKTPTGSLFEGAEPRGGSSSSGTLAQQVQYGLLPTPNAADGLGGRQHKAGSISPTGRKLNGAKAQVSIQDRLSLLPTPQALDGIKSPKYYAGGNPSLPHTIAMLPTPTVNGNNNRAGLSEKSGDGLQTAIRGQNSGLKLQPAFVRWMLGYPADYDDLGDLPLEISSSSTTETP